MLAGMPRRIVWVLLAAYLIGLALIAYWPTPVDRGVDGDLFGLIHWLDRHGVTVVTYDRVESAANVALFVPFGLLLAGLFRRGRRWIAFLVCVAGSVAIETGQALFLPARYASVADVLANAAGAAIGVLAVVAVSRIRRARATSHGAGPRVKNP
jgi:hypothetical protein